MTTRDELAPEQSAWLAADEKRWQRAHAIATDHPGVDVGGVYHVLENLEKTPSQRVEIDVDGVPIRVLELERIIASKRATARVKDLAVLPALEEALDVVESKA